MSGTLDQVLNAYLAEATILLNSYGVDCGA
jgi:hypothetical protein